MKVVLLNTSERTGGAAIAANRLMNALINSGIEAKTLVLKKQTDDENVISIQSSFLNRLLAQFYFLWERWVIFLHNHFSKENLFKVSIANTGFDVSKHPLVKQADIIHIHWINQGFLSLKSIKNLTKSGKPVVWTMHDMWACTGICHHAWNCKNNIDTCGNCLFLKSNKKNDLSHRILRKKKFLSETNIHIITVSTWLKNLAKNSILTKSLNISVIPNSIDTSLFYPSEKTMMRKKFSFPEDKKIILMGAAKLNDPIKGFNYLKQALKLLKEKRKDILLVLFGRIKDCESFLSDLDVEFFHLDLIDDVSLIVQLYATADVTVVSSNYETFGQTLIESMACGCPAVSFDNSGQTDIIDHKINGYLAKYQDSDDLAAGILWVLDNSEILNLPEACLRKVKNFFTNDHVANQYIRLYESILK